MIDDEKNGAPFDNGDAENNTPSPVNGKENDDVQGNGESQNAKAEESVPDLAETDKSGENVTDDAQKHLFKVTIPGDIEYDEPDADDKSDGESSVPADPKPQKTNEKKRHPLLKAFVYTFSIIAASFLLAGFALFSATDFLGMFRAEHSCELKVAKTDTVKTVSAKLKDEGIIRSAFVFNIYAKIADKDTIHDGDYSFNSSMSYDEILRTLRQAPERETVKVTIPEGFTVQSIAETLEKKKVCSKEDFLTAVKNTAVKFDFGADIPNDPNRFYRLEGYLFPDTYEFYVNQAPDSVVKKMLDNFDIRFSAEFRSAAKATGMTVDQIVTLASIIQTESGQLDEMGKVSSVFHNRLTKGVSGKKLLQSDATIFYATREIEPVLSKAGTEIASAYNTYKHEGLTPGPICNPGLAAIDAAITPDKTDYYYFVTDKSGKYYYSETYAQHLKNVAKAVKTGQAGGTNVTD